MSRKQIMMEKDPIKREKLMEHEMRMAEQFAEAVKSAPTNGELQRAFAASLAETHRQRELEKARREEEEARRAREQELEKHRKTYVNPQLFGEMVSQFIN